MDPRLTPEQQVRYDELCHKRYETNESLTAEEFNEWAELDRIVYPATSVGKDLTRDYTTDEVYQLFD